MTKKDSTAVMARRDADREGLDFYRTPPWATRALLEHLFNKRIARQCDIVLDPCAGDGDMTKVLKERFDKVSAGDVQQYGYKLDKVWDFPKDCYSAKLRKVDWVIANPPFNKASEFILAALWCAKRGVAILGRIQLLESAQRYGHVFQQYPPSRVICFSERVAYPTEHQTFEEGQSAMMSAWFVWKAPFHENINIPPRIYWFPPGTKDRCQHEYQKPIV